MNVLQNKTAGILIKRLQRLRPERPANERYTKNDRCNKKQQNRRLCAATGL